MRKIFIVLIGVLIASCGGIDKNKHSEAIEFKDQKIQEVYDSYLKTKNALTESDPKKGAENAGLMAVRLSGLSDSSATAKKAYQDAIEMSKVTEIKEQRAIFAGLSQTCYQLFKKADKTGTLFLDHCPMAQDGKGADWVSDKEEIKNPYFGTEMMECGEVKEKF